MAYHMYYNFGKDYPALKIIPDVQSTDINASSNID